MTERAIPEILGWEPAPPEWGLVDRWFQHPTRGHVVHEADGWTVDDLLTWIRSKGYDVTSTAQRTHLAGERLLGERPVRLTFKPFRGWLAGLEAPTLLEALEAAVRAIDARENP